MDRILTKREFAAHFKVSERTVDRLRDKGIVNPPISYPGGPGVRFHIKDVLSTENYFRLRQIGVTEAGMPETKTAGVSIPASK